MRSFPCQLCTAMAIHISRWCTHFGRCLIEALMFWQAKREQWLAWHTTTIMSVLVLFLNIATESVFFSRWLIASTEQRCSFSVMHTFTVSYGHHYFARKRVITSTLKTSLIIGTNNEACITNYRAWSPGGCCWVARNLAKCFRFVVYAVSKTDVNFLH